MTCFNVSTARQKNAKAPVRTVQDKVKSAWEETEAPGS